MKLIERQIQILIEEKEQLMSQNEKSGFSKYLHEAQIDLIQKDIDYFTSLKK